MAGRRWRVYVTSSGALMAMRNLAMEKLQRHIAGGHPANITVRSTSCGTAEHRRRKK